MLAHDDDHDDVQTEEPYEHPAGVEPQPEENEDEPAEPAGVQTEEDEDELAELAGVQTVEDGDQETAGVFQDHGEVEDNIFEESAGVLREDEPNAQSETQLGPSENEQTVSSLSDPEPAISRPVVRKSSRAQAHKPSSSELSPGSSPDAGEIEIESENAYTEPSSDFSTSAATKGTGS